MTLHDRLARARADLRELAWIEHRIAAARADRERVATQLSISERARDYEQADVDRLTMGLLAGLRRLLRDRTDLTREQQELAAAQVVAEAVAEELRAIDVDLEQLAARAAPLRDANARYAEALAELEVAARSRGELHAELDALNATHADLSATRREIGEVARLGVQLGKDLKELVLIARTLVPGNPQFDDGPGLLEWLTGEVSDLRRDLARTRGVITHGMQVFERACRKLASTREIDLPFPPPPVPDGLESGSIDLAVDETSRISTMVGVVLAALRAHDTTLATALAECEQVRARLLESRAIEP